MISLRRNIENFPFFVEGCGNKHFQTYLFISLKEYGISDLFSKIYVSSVYGQLKKDGDFFDNPIRDFNIKKND